MWGMITGPMNLNDELSSTTPHEWKPFNLQNIIFLVISKTKKKILYMKEIAFIALVKSVQ